MGELTAIANAAAEQGIEQSNEALEESLRPSVNEIIFAAKDLVNYAYSLYANVSQIEEAKNRLQSVRDEQSAITAAFDFNRKMIKTKEQYTQIMDKVFNLQNKVNEFLGQKIQMVYVYIPPKGGEVQLYKVDNTVENLKITQASSKKGGDFRGRYNYSLSALKEHERLFKENYNDDKLQATFAEVNKRFQIGRKKTGISLILWYVGGWQGAWISSAGVLAEAFAAFYLNEYVFSNDMEINVGDFVAGGKYSAVTVDNTSGFLEGDISIGNMQYGIKAKNASALGYMQILKIAQELVSLGDMTAEELGSFLEEQKARLHSEGKQTLAGRLDLNLTGTYEDLLNMLQLNNNWKEFKLTL